MTPVQFRHEFKEIFSEFIKAKAAQCIDTERLSNSQTLSLSGLGGHLNVA